MVILGAMLRLWPLGLLQVELTENSKTGLFDAVLLGHIQPPHIEPQQQYIQPLHCLKCIILSLHSVLYTTMGGSTTAPKTSTLQNLFYSNTWVAQFIIVLKKNIVLRLRSWKTLILECVFPIVIIGILVGLMGMCHYSYS